MLHKTLRKNMIFIFILTLIITVSGSFTQILNQDKPEKGTWDFKLEKIWQAEKPGDEEFGRPAELRATSVGTLVMHDFMNKKSYIFNNNGEFVTSFAGQEQNPGYVEMYINCFIADKYIVASSPQSLYFYSPDGKYIKTMPNNIFANFPYVFLSDDEFLGGPGSLANLIGKTVIIKSTNCSTGDAKTFCELPANKELTKEGSGGQAPPFVILGVTPQLSIAGDRENGKLYYGRTDEYNIHISDLKGKEFGNFTLERDRKKFTEEDKQEFIAQLGLPEEQAKPMLALLPDKLSHFFKILVNNGLIYVIAVDEVSQKLNKLHIDIFSPEGKYLYRSLIDFGDKLFFKNPENIVFQGKYLYAILYSSDSEKKSLEKFKISLPRRQN
ncbi:hypothetical protein ACFL4T_05700 [candidate division KSB1 bacterium]